MATDLGASASLSPETAQLRSTTKAKRFAWNDPKWQEVQDAVYQSWMAAEKGRANLLDNLRVCNALYEMEHPEEMDSPWDGASNIIQPIIPAELEALRDYIIMAVFTPNLFLVKGLTPEAQDAAPKVQAWLNDLLQQEREGGETWYEILISMIQASARDGSAGVMVTWIRREREKLIISFGPKVDENGTLVVGGDGRPAKERKISRLTDVISEPLVEPLLLKDIKWAPAESRHIQKAAFVSITKWMYEEDLLELAKGMGDDPKNGVFSREALELALSYVEDGLTDTPNDPDGSYDKDAGGQLDPNIGQGTVISETFRNRGPIMLELCLSKQHDMNGDGRVEKNWFWLHPQSQTMIGWMTYEYLINRWPIEMFSMFPRVQQIPGFSIPERLADTVDSMDANKNQRINYQDMVVSPPLMEQAGNLVRTKEMSMSPGVRWPVEDVDKSLKYLQLPPVVGTTFMEDAQDKENIAKVTGQAAPMVSGQSPTRTTATAARQQAAAQQTRSGTIALFFRFFLRRFINLVFALYLECSDNDPEYQEGNNFLTLPRELLTLPYRIDVAGITDPTDMVSAQNQMAMWANEIRQMYPARFQKPSAQRLLAEAYSSKFNNIPNLEAILGTAEEAKQLDDAQAAQAKATMEAAQGGQQQPGAQ